jgi:hypothetical protein
MTVNQEDSNSAERNATTHRRSAAVAVLVASATIALAACGGSKSPSVASLTTSAGPGSGGDGNSVGRSSVTAGGSTAAKASKRNPAALLDQWATCMRSHGDPNQADPTIDVHGVINIYMSGVSPQVSSQVRGGMGAQTGSCSQYLTAAQRLLRAANPVPPAPDKAELLTYAACMRANGVPNYPDPTGEKANFNGTGIDANSPAFQRANDVCAKRIHAPTYWINGWGPPGDVSVRSIVGGSGPPPSGFGG